MAADEQLQVTDPSQPMTKAQRDEIHATPVEAPPPPSPLERLQTLVAKLQHPTTLDVTDRLHHTQATVVELANIVGQLVRRLDTPQEAPPDA